MSTSPAVWSAFAGIISAVAGFFVFGILALLLACALFGTAIIVLSGEVEGMRNPVPEEPAHPFRYACPGCGGDVYWGQATCPECGHALPGVQTAKA